MYFCFISSVRRKLVAAQPEPFTMKLPLLVPVALLVGVRGDPTTRLLACLDTGDTLDACIAQYFVSDKRRRAFTVRLLIDGYVSYMNHNTKDTKISNCSTLFPFFIIGEKM